MQSFDGKVALITGGNGGVGLGLARALAPEGARLAIAGTSAAKLDAALATLRAAGASAITLALDIADPQAWPAALDRVEAALGPVDLLCLNAGINSAHRNIEDFSFAEWRRLMEVNVDGLFHGLKACLPRMKARRAESHILITASIGAFTRRPLASPYDVSKTAVLAIAEILRAELKDGPIGVSVLCTAGVRSDFYETSQRHSPGLDAQDFAWLKKAGASGMDPLKIGQFAVKCIREGRFYIFTHPGMKRMVEPRLGEILAEFKDSADPGGGSFGA